MDLEHFSRFFPAICAGFGLFLAGLVNLLLLRRGVRLRLLATLLAVGVALGAAWALEQPGAVAGTARLLAVGLVAFLVLSSRRLTDGAAALICSAGRPAVRCTLLTVAGVGTVIGSVVVFERADERATDQVLSDLDLVEGLADTTPSTRATALTDRGTQVVLYEPISPRDQSRLSETENHVLQRSRFEEQLIRRGPADDQSNCHGWVFTGGRFRVGGDQVEVILKENGYQEVHDPRPGDLVVYRSEVGAISHTAIVRYVAEGQPVLVEGKWGNLGVYIHPVDKSLYGADYTIRRSARKGHLLLGLGGNPAPADNQAKTTPTE